MTFEEAIAAQPAWVVIWLYILLAGGFVLPFALLIWRQSRIPGIATILANLAAGFGVAWLYGQMGYVKLLGLPHILFWTPLVIYLATQIRRPDMPLWPRRIMIVVVAVLLISLAFDYTDVARYILGERTPMPGTLPQ